MFRIEASVKAGFPDSEGDRLEKEIRDIGITTVKQARVSDMYLHLSPSGSREGKVVIKLGALEELNVALYYTEQRGDIRAGYPHNPNGSVNNIAGVCDATGRIFALMPHPERFIRWMQHPRWTREPRRDYGDGFRIFLNAVEWAKSI